jgi:hypothetical protein
MHDLPTRPLAAEHLSRDTVSSSGALGPPGYPGEGTCLGGNGARGECG